MDLTPLRPTSSVLSSKAHKQECVSRPVTRLSAWIVASTLVLADRDPRSTDPPRRPLIYLFAFLSYSLHRLFVVLLHAKLPENPDKSTSCHFAARNWSGRPSATRPRRSQGLPSMTMLVNFALWPPFCSGTGSRNQNLALERAWKLVFVRGAHG